MKVRLLSDTLAPACARGCTWCSVAGRLAGCHLFRPARRGQSRRRHGAQRGGRGCVTGGAAAAVLQRSAVRRRLAHGAQRRDRRHRDYKQPWCAAGRGHATRQKDGKSQKRKDLISAPCGLGHLSGSGSRAYGSADPSLCQTSPTGQRHSPKGVPWISPRVLAGRPKQLDALSNWSNLSNWMHPPRRVLQGWARAPEPRATRSDDAGSPRALMSPRSAGAARFSGGSQPNAHASYFRAFVRAPRRTPSYPPARRATMFACVL